MSADSTKKSLYNQIGQSMIDKAVALFYDQAFEDPIIGHFFFSKDKDDLIKKQIQFSSSLLGSSDHSYKGKPLKTAHMALPLGLPHFRRRQIIFKQVLEKLNLEPNLIDQWLNLEERLKPLILNTGNGASCSEK